MQCNIDLQPRALLGSAKVLVPVDFSPVPLRDMTQSIVARLERHPWLLGMSRAHLELLAECATVVEFKRGEVLFREGDVADGIYLIETGKIREESSVSRQPTPTEGWMFPPHIRTCTVRALEPTTAIFLSAPILRDLCEKDISLGYDFLKRLCLATYQYTLDVQRKAEQPHRSL